MALSSRAAGARISLTVAGTVCNIPFLPISGEGVLCVRVSLTSTRPNGSHDIGNQEIAAKAVHLLAQHVPGAKLIGSFLPSNSGKGSSLSAPERALTVCIAAPKLFPDVARGHLYWDLLYTQLGVTLLLSAHDQALPASAEDKRNWLAGQPPGCLAVDYTTTPPEEVTSAVLRARFDEKRGAEAGFGID